MNGHKVYYLEGNKKEVKRREKELQKWDVGDKTPGGGLVIETIRDRWTGTTVVIDYPGPKNDIRVWATQSTIEMFY